MKNSTAMGQLKLGLIYLAIALLVFLATKLYGQDEKVLYSNKWKAGNEKQLYNHKVTKVQSGGYGYTHIAYKDTMFLLREVEQQAANEMWTKARKDEKLQFLKYAKGGMLELYIGRLTIGSGNLEYFTVVIQDESGNEIFRKELEEDIPEVPGSDRLWWNIKTIVITEQLNPPFNVYVIDELDDENPRHHFVVSN
jgi:hypothetical protein